MSINFKSVYNNDIIIPELNEDYNCKYFELKQFNMTRESNKQFWDNNIDVAKTCHRIYNTGLSISYPENYTAILIPIIDDYDDGYYECKIIKSADEIFIRFILNNPSFPKLNHINTSHVTSYSNNNNTIAKLYIVKNIHDYDLDIINELILNDKKEKLTNYIKRLNYINIKCKSIHPNAVLPTFSNIGNAVNVTAVSCKKTENNNIIYKTGLVLKIPSGYFGLLLNYRGGVYGIVKQNHEISFIYDNMHIKFSTGDIIGKILILNTPIISLEWDNNEVNNED